MNRDDIKIYELKRMDLTDAIVIDGFPSVGLVSTIAANYLISVLELKQIGVLDSMYFPTVSVIRNGEPHNPVRIYGGTYTDKENVERTIVVFTSEFQPPSQLVKPIASTILDWVQEQNCKMIVSPEGLVIEDPDVLSPVVEKEEEGKDDDESAADTEGNGNTEGSRLEELRSFVEKARQLDVYGVSSVPEGMEMMDGHGVKLFTEGVISGVAGVLLNEGKRRKFNVITLLAEAKADFPDARAAARIIEVLNAMAFNGTIDVAPLYAEAEMIESKIKSMHRQAPPESTLPPPGPMYG